jgi:hypothetical protein
MIQADCLNCAVYQRLRSAMRFSLPTGVTPNYLFDDASKTSDLLFWHHSAYQRATNSDQPTPRVIFNE